MTWAADPPDPHPIRRVRARPKRASQRPVDLDDLQRAAYLDVQAAHAEVVPEHVDDLRHPMDRAADEWEANARGDY